MVCTETQTSGYCVKASEQQHCRTSCEVQNEHGVNSISAAQGGWGQVRDSDTRGGDSGVSGDMERSYEEDDIVADDTDHLADGLATAFDRDGVLVVETDGLTAAAPDGGWGWMIVFVSFLCSSIVDGLCSVFGVLLPDLVVYFQQPSSTVTIAGSLLAGGFLLYGMYSLSSTKYYL